MEAESLQKPLFAKAVSILACDTTNEAEEAMAYAATSKEDATTSNKYTKKTQKMSEKEKKLA